MNSPSRFTVSPVSLLFIISYLPPISPIKIINHFMREGTEWNSSEEESGIFFLCGNFKPYSIIHSMQTALVASKHLLWHYGKIPLTKDTHPSTSPFLKKSYILPPSEHICTIWSSSLSPSAHKSPSLLKHLDCILLWHINLHIWNIYFKKKMWQKTNIKNKAVGCGNCRLKSDQFVLVETSCTVPLCLEIMPQNFFILPVWATTC